MNNFVTYMLESVAVGALFYGFYFLVLKNITSFKLSRFYLLLSAALMFILPLIEVPVSSNIVAVSYGTVFLDEIEAVGHDVEQSTFPAIFTILSYAYILISTVLVFKFIIGFVSVFRIYRKSSTIFFGDKKLVLMNNQLSPFSFFGIVFIRKHDVEDYDRLKQILIHEDTHISQMHTLDNIFAGILSSLFWFNPFIWLTKYSLKSTHEYLADANVLEQGFEPAGYFMLLFSDIVGIKTGLANNFNNSLTLKRMKMMKKERSPRYLRWLYLMVLPLIGMVVFANSCTEEKSKTGKLDNGDSNEVEQVDEKIYEAGVIDVVPVFGESDDALMTYLSTEIVYPEQAKQKGIEGKVFVEFTVSKKGKVIDAKVVEPINEYLDAEALRVVSEMPEWKPGKEDGKAVNVKFVIPINFKLK